MDKIDWIIDRLTEKSTYIGVFQMAAMFGLTFSGRLQDSVIQAIMGLVGVYLVILSEKKK